MIHNCDCLEGIRELPENSIDLLVTDPPYGISFMGRSWDKALPDKKVWAECLRVLKPGAFAFVMSIPRSDCLSRMIISIEEAGFMVNFTPIFWTYATGMPKAQNISKVIDKKFGVGSEAKALDGSYSYNPKPSVEVIIVAQKPKTAKTFVDQALLWYEERQIILQELAIELKVCYNIDGVEWEE